MTIPRINLDKLRQQDFTESSATENSNSTEVTEESSSTDVTEESSHDSSQGKKSDAKPRMSTTTSQPDKNSFASSSSLASHRNTGRTTDRTTEKSSAPLLSPRTAPPGDNPPPLPQVPVSLRNSLLTASTTASTATSTTTTLTSAHPNTSNSSTSSTNSRSSTSTSSTSTSSKVIVFKLPNPNIIMKPAELAKLLVAADSMKYTKCLVGSKIETILRSNTKVVASSESNAEGVLINETYLKPFMSKYFETTGVIKMQNTIVNNYTDQSKTILDLYQEIGDGNKFSRSDKVAVIMKPLIAPAIDFICGKDMSLESSGLPKPVLELMLAVDEEVTIWFNKNGSGKPEDLLDARSNALTSFFGTRSFMGTWAVELSTDPSKPVGFYRPLTSYLNTYLNLQVKNFSLKLMGATAEQRKIVSKQASIIDSRTALARDKKAVRGESSIEKFGEMEKTEKKGLLNFFNKEKNSELLSPRGKKETETLHSPRRQLQRGETLQENASRDVTRTNNRKKFVKDFIATQNLKQKEIAKFLISFQKSVVELTREEYKACKADPLAYSLTYLRTYTNRLVTRGETPQSEIDALWELKDKLDDAKAIADVQAIADAQAIADDY